MTLPSMQDAQRKSRSQSRLSRGLERNLSAYTLAAGSAGVALLACVQPADAKIVATKTNIVVPPVGSISFDINNDGQMDFALSQIFEGGCTSTATSARKAHGKRHTAGTPPLGCGFFYDALLVAPQQAANEALVTKSDFRECANAVGRDATIGPTRHFAAGPAPMSINSGTSEGNFYCPWALEHPPYLGVKFVDTEGKLHYGWVRISMRHDYSTVIEAYAYETIPNKPIPAGVASGDDEASLVDPSSTLAPKATEAATLGRLAQGASGLAAWRREDEVIAA
jgi:hypothetical protein